MREITTKQLEDLAKLVKKFEPYSFSFFLHHVPKEIIPKKIYKLDKSTGEEDSYTKYCTEGIFAGIIFPK